MKALSNLKIWQKLALLGTLAAALLIWLSAMMYSDHQKLGVEVASKAVDGATYEAAVLDLLQRLQIFRLRTAGVLAGEASLRAKADEAARDIEAALKAVDDVDAEYGGGLGLSARWAPLKDQIRNVVSSKTTSAVGAYKAQTQVISDLVGFLAQLGNASNLAADPDVDSNRLIDATTYAIPEAAELMAKLAAQAVVPAVQNTIDPDQRDDLLKQFALSNYYVTRIKTNYDRAFTVNDSLKADLEGVRVASEKATKKVMDQLENEFLLTREDVVSVPAVSWVDTSTAAITAHYDLAGKTIPVLKELLEDRVSSRQNNIRGRFMIIIIFLVLAGAVGLVIIRDITGPLAEAVDAATRIAAGDLTANVRATDRRDEIGVLTNAFDNMIRNLRTQIQSLSTGIESLTTTTSDFIVALTEIVAGATQAASAVNEAATTAEEVKQTARLASDRAQEVASSAHQAVRVAQEGERSVDEAVEGMTKVREQMESIAESVVKLGEQSRAIGEIIAAVNDLAEQSNLLAVNASIEAAKAGEHGKGFAVVAQEVKNLAAQSKQATSQVRQILNDIQKAAGVAVMVTEQGTRSAESGVRQSIVAGESIRALAKNIADAAQSVTQITVSSQQQLVGMDQVAGAMDSIREAANHNVDSMRQIEGAVQNLGEVCANLQSLAGRYRLSSNGASA